MTEPERPLRLDAPREEALEHAARLVDRGLAELRPVPARGAAAGRARAAAPRGRAAVGPDLRCTRRSTTPRGSWTSRSRSRGLGTSRSSARAGLEIGALADLLAHTYDINLAVDARAATQVEDQAVRWVASSSGSRRRAVRSRAAAPSATSARWRRPANARCRDRAHRARRASRGRLLLRRRSTTRSRGRSSCWGSARTTCARSPLDGLAPDAARRARRGDRSPTSLPASRRWRWSRRPAPRSRARSTRSRRSPTSARPGRVAPRRRRLRSAGGGHRVARGGVRGPRAGRLVLGRRSQVAVPAEGLRRRPGAGRRCASPPRSRTNRATCRTSSTSCMPSTSRWSTRGRSAP